MDAPATKMTEPMAAWATDCRDKYGENHDSGFAGRICLSDGNLAWAAVVSDGCGGSIEGLKVSGLAIQAFVAAVRSATLRQLTDAEERNAWLRAWTESLHNEAFSRFRGGMATFCGAVILPPSGEGASWKLFSINVGDSQVLRRGGDGKVLGINPDAPANHPNMEGRNPVRVVGVAPKNGFPLMDVEEFPLPVAGPCWILAGSDGFFSKKQGRDELQIFGYSDFRELCTSGEAPFHELPALALRRTLENAQKLGCAEMMDNATVAMLGFNVPNRLGAGVLPEPGKGFVKAVPPPTVPVSATPVAKAVPAKPKGVRKFKKMAVAAILGFVTGLVVAGMSSKSPESTPQSNDDAPVVSGEVKSAEAAAQAESVGVPVPGKRCERCWNLRKAGADVKPYHWAVDCPNSKA